MSDGERVGLYLMAQPLCVSSEQLRTAQRIELDTLSASNASGDQKRTRIYE